MTQKIEKTAAEIAKEKNLIEIGEYAGTLRRCIHAISAKAPTSMTGILQKYVRHVHASMKNNRDSEFPVTVRRHPLNVERCNTEGGKYDLLCFHIGNAILTYYDALGTGEVRVDLLRRMNLITKIAEAGMAKVFVDGNIKEGFHLVVPNSKTPKKSVQSVA